MPYRDPKKLANRVAELEADNRRLKRSTSWAITRLRECASNALAAISELEADLLLGEQAKAS